MTAPEPTTPTRDSVLTFREITEHNWRAVANLRLPPSQRGNLAANVWSLAEAAYSEDAWLRAIYADSTLVGFLMLAIWDPNCAYYIWRLMIDERYQGLGFGKQAVQHAIAHVKQNHPQAKQLGVMSTPREGKGREGEEKWVKSEDSPWRFYEKLGFRETEGPDEDGDVMMMMDL